MDRQHDWHPTDGAGRAERCASCGLVRQWLDGEWWYDDSVTTPDGYIPRWTQAMSPCEPLPAAQMAQAGARSLFD